MAGLRQAPLRRVTQPRISPGKQNTCVKRARTITARQRAFSLQSTGVRGPWVVAHWLPGLIAAGHVAAVNEACDYHGVVNSCAKHRDVTARAGSIGAGQRLLGHMATSRYTASRGL